MNLEHISGILLLDILVNDTEVEQLKVLKTKKEEVMMHGAKVFWLESPVTLNIPISSGPGIKRNMLFSISLWQAATFWPSLPNCDLHRVNVYQFIYMLKHHRWSRNNQFLDRLLPKH